MRDARELLSGLVGRTVPTLTGKPNRVLRVEAGDVIVGTERSPAGTPVPIEEVQAALDLLYQAGQVTIDVPTVGHRSAFIGAALASIPGVLSSSNPGLVRLPPPLRPLLERALSEITNPRPEHYSKDDPFAALFTRELEDAVTGIVAAGASYLVKGSAGQGNWAETPWVAVFDRLVTESAQNGYYVVYLFKADGSGVYLSLNQGTTAVLAQAKSRYREVLEDRSRMYARLLGPEKLGDLVQGRIVLGEGRTALTPGYEAGNIAARYYAAGSIPPEDALVSDLRSMLRTYSSLIEAVDRVEETETEGPGEPPATTQEARRLRWHLRAEGRNRTAAKEAKRVLGYTCTVCDFNFEARYGSLGRNYIEAHHLTPFSKLDERPRDLDPATDFAVVCSNCHRMLHQKVPPWTIEDLRKKILEVSSK